MGLTPSPRLTRAVRVLVAVLLVAALVDGVNLWRASRDNARITAGSVMSPTDPALPSAAPELRFALAHALAASGASEAALNQYRALFQEASKDDSPLGQAARFNSANLLLRQAIDVRATAQPGQAITLLELAKESLRDVLRRDPQHWDARYNLERAQRLLPDPDDADNEPPQAARDRERAATTMRGVSPGLP